MIYPLFLFCKTLTNYGIACAELFLTGRFAHDPMSKFDT